MKAVVVEIGEKYAVALNKKGEFVKIKNNGRLTVGYEVDAVPVSGFSWNSYAKVASMAAVFLFAVSIGVGAYSYTKPYSYIDVDINPSLELVANRFDRIIDAKALNDDGAKLLAAGEYKNKGIQEGIDSILKSAAEEGYLKTDVNNAVLFTVSGKDEEKVAKVEAGIKARAAEDLKATKLETQVLTEKISLERRDEALKQGVSPGKLLLIERVRQYEPDAKAEDLKKAPVRDLVKTINENKKEEKAETKDDKKQEQQQKKQDKQESKDTGKSSDIKKEASPAPANAKISTPEPKEKKSNTAESSVKGTEQKQKTEEKDKEQEKEQSKEKDKEKDSQGKAKQSEHETKQDDKKKK